MAGIVFNPLLLNGFQFSSSGGGGGGTVTSVGLSDGSSTPIYTISGSPVVGAGTLTFTLSNEPANTVFAGPTSGGAAQPTFRALVNADIPSSLVLSGTISASNLSGTNTGNVTLGTASGLSLAGQVLSLQLADATHTGALSSTDWNTFNSKQPAGNYANTALSNLITTSINQDLLPSSSGAHDLGAFNNAWGSVNSEVFVISNGTVGKATFEVGGITPAGLSVGASIQGSGNSALGLFSASGNSSSLVSIETGQAITGTSGLINIETGDVTGGTGNSGNIKFQIGTSAGGTRGKLQFVDGSEGTSGQIWTSTDTVGSGHWAAAPASGVTSVALADSTGLFNITGSPVTSTGTLTLASFQSQAQHSFFAAPSGSAGAPTFRAIAASDVPTLNQNTTGTASNITASSNSTLTTLSVLSLPASQLTGLGNLTDVGTDGIVITSGTGAVIGAGTSIAQHVSDATHNGYLSSTDWSTFNGKQAAGNYITALTGDATASGPGSVALTLATVASAGTTGSSTAIPVITINAKGLTTSITTAAVIAPAGTLSGTTLNATVVTSSLTSLGAQAAALNMNSHKINNVTDPTSAQDAATKAYVDNVAAGINPAIAVQAATTSAANTSGYTYNNGVSGIGATLTANATNTALTVDGFTFTALNQRLLVKNDTQSPSGAFNGIYYVTQVQALGLPVILTRALDYDQPSDINNTGAIPVINGTVNGTTQWVLTSLVNTVGTDPLTFTQFARNPADYLLKANNLSDVANANTSFNNISPMTTGGDIIYGGASGAGTRLANGSSGQILKSNGGTLAPSWATFTNGFAFFASGAVTSASSDITGTSFATFSNSPAFTFTPSVTGTYKIYGAIPLLQGTAGVQGFCKIINSTGGATLLYESQGTNFPAILSSVYTQSVYTLTTSVSYVFDIQGKNSSTGALSIDAAGTSFYLFAELCG